MASSPPEVNIGESYCLGKYGYFVTVRDIHTKTSTALVHYDGYHSAYDAWVPIDKICVPPAKRVRRAAVAHDDAPEQDMKAPAPKAAVQVPRAGSLVEVFDVRAGWRAGHVGESSPFGTIVHFVVNNDEQMAGATVVQLRLDFQGGNVRWPRPKQRSQPAELEGRRVLVPCSVFHQGGYGSYAGTIKRATNLLATIYFPIDGKEIKFAIEQVRGWLVDVSKDESAVDKWDQQVPTRPSGWPGHVLFCSFPLQHGLDPRLLKRMCSLSECMRGVEIRQVPEGHVLAGTRYSLGLYATRDFKRGVTLGQYAGCIQSDIQCSWRKVAGQQARVSEGRYDIDLDTTDGLNSAQRGLSLDALHVGNESRLINDFRGIATENNVRFKTCANPSKGIWVDVVVTRLISKGDEILADYDYGTREEEGNDDDEQQSTPMQSSSSSSRAIIASNDTYERVWHGVCREHSRAGGGRGNNKAALIGPADAVWNELAELCSKSHAESALLSDARVAKVMEHVRAKRAFEMCLGNASKYHMATGFVQELYKCKLMHCEDDGRQMIIQGTATHESIQYDEGGAFFRMEPSRTSRMDVKDFLYVVKRGGVLV